MFLNSPISSAVYNMKRMGPNTEPGGTAQTSRTGSSSTQSQKTSLVFSAITRESIVGF